jgi:hypothetical protein
MNASVKGGCAPPEKCKPPTEAELRREAIAKRIETLLGRVILGLEHHKVLTRVLNFLRGPLVPDEEWGEQEAAELVDAIRAAATKLHDQYDRQTVQLALVEVQVIVNYFRRNRFTWP